MPRRAAVALSGGLDSAALLYQLCEQLGSPNLVALHIDHQARSPESCRDECRLVDQLCQQLKIELRRQQLPKVDQPSEEALRKFRYEALANMAKDCDWIALAHHRDDQVETILMHIFRGSDAAGWSGMPEFFHRHQSLFIRPFLQHMDRHGLIAFQKKKNFPFYDDPSNLSPKYLRNRYRHELLPLIEDIAPQARGKILQLGKVAGAWSTYLDQELQKYSQNLCWREDQVHHWSYPREPLQQWPLLILEAWCHRQLCHFAQKTGNINRKHVLDLAQWIQSDARGAHPRPFPANLRFRARKREIILLNNRAPEDK